MNVVAFFMLKLRKVPLSKPGALWANHLTVRVWSCLMFMADSRCKIQLQELNVQSAAGWYTLWLLYPINLSAGAGLWRDSRELLGRPCRPLSHTHPLSFSGTNSSLFFCPNRNCCFVCVTTSIFNRLPGWERVVGSQRNFRPNRFHKSGMKFSWHPALLNTKVQTPVWVQSNSSGDCWDTSAWTRFEGPSDTQPDIAISRATLM